MKIIKPFTLGVLQRPYTFLGQTRLGVAALGFFRLGQANERLLDDHAQWPLVLPLLPGGVPLDEAMPKAQAEALVLGRAFAPDGKPAPCVCVRLQVGTLDKSLCVTGPRDYRLGLLRRHRISPPEPFVSLPLDAAHAYGGPGHPGNPDGTGFAGWRGLGRTRGRMPCIEYPARPVSSHWRRLAPAGFGPVPTAVRMGGGKFGTYGKRWLAQEAPGLASDIDWSVFNLAPPDQWLAQGLAGGQAYRLEGMHPDHPFIAGHLPRVRARAFLLGKDAPADQCTEVDLALDTVWFLPEQELGILVFHGAHPIADIDARDVGTLMVGYENLGETRSEAHYQKVLRWRSDPASAGLHAFDESQLAPAWSAATQAAHAAAEGAADAADQARCQDRLDLLDAQFWREQGHPAPAGHAAPRAPARARGKLSPHAVAAGDFNLAATMASAQEQLSAARMREEARLAQLRADPALARMRELVPDPDKQYADALARAIVPAYDLFPAHETGSDPRHAEQKAQLDSAHAAGQLDAARHHQALDALAAAPAMQRRARRLAPTPAVRPLCAGAAQRLGRQVCAWLREGVALAGRDLAGADLRGAMLDGADLREVMLERADLRHVSLRRADLRGAVLTGAQLAQADLGDAMLDGANLSGSDAAGARLAGASLRDARAVGARWPGACLEGAILDRLLAMRIDLTGACLDGVQALETNLIEAHAADSGWRGAVLDKVLALRAVLVRSDWSRARLRATTVLGADFTHSIWEGGRWDALQAAAAATCWRGARLRGLRARNCGLNGACLSCADLTGAHFMRCDLGACLLDGACLDNAHFPHSSLMGASLPGASARGSDFYRALCRHIDLSGAVLSGARFAGAELSGALMATDGSAT